MDFENMTYGDLYDWMVKMAPNILGSTREIFLPCNLGFKYYLRNRVEIRSYQFEWVIEVYKSKLKESEAKYPCGSLGLYVSPTKIFTADIDRTIYDKNEPLHELEKDIDEFVRLAAEYHFDEKVMGTEFMTRSLKRLILVPFPNIINTITSDLTMKR